MGFCPRGHVVGVLVVFSDLEMVEYLDPMQGCRIGLAHQRNHPLL